MAVNPPKAEAMKDDSGTGLPASIEAAWGLRERPAKGPKRGLSLERIVEAAVNVATAEGLGAVSMSRVAAELGASTMSLYRYVSAKDELLALMVDAAYGLPPVPEAPDEGWREGLSRWAWGELAALRRHPWVVRVPFTAPPLTPNNIAWLEAGLRALRGTGLAEQEKMSTILLLSGFVRNWATLITDLVEAARAAGSTVDEAMAGYGRTLAKLIDAERFPELSMVIAAGALDDEGEPEDAEFIFGLERVLDGVEVLVRARA
jgi:AcrR family transcriptional regulator